MAVLLYEKREHVAVFTLNRPERRNALTGELFRELDEALADFTADPEMRAGVLTGAPPAFCAGMDLRRQAEKDSGGASSPRPRRRTGAGPFLACDKPFVAAINGICVSGGLELALDCDIRICSDEATFGLFETKRGLYPGYAVHHLGRLIPFGEAMYLVLTAEAVGPADALRWGLVHEVTAAGELMPRALAIAGAIAANAPLAVQGAKAVARDWRLLGADASYRMEDWVRRTVAASEDAREGPRAFVEKRPPRWQGR